MSVITCEYGSIHCLIKEMLIYHIEIKYLFYILSISLHCLLCLLFDINQKSTTVSLMQLLYTDCKCQPFANMTMTPNHTVIYSYFFRRPPDRPSVVFGSRETKFLPSYVKRHMLQTALPGNYLTMSLKSHIPNFVKKKKKIVLPRIRSHYFTCQKRSENSLETNWNEIYIPLGDLYICLVDKSSSNILWSTDLQYPLLTNKNDTSKLKYPCLRKFLIYCYLSSEKLF